MRGIFTKERVIYGIVLALLGLAGTIVTARSQAAQPLNDFKIETVKEFGSIRGDIQTNKAITEQQNMETNRRLESIEGSLQTLTSAVLQAVKK